MFKDEAEITVKAGDGGKGCVAFRREKYVPKGGPSGGDGGKGGDVVIYASTHCNTLLDLTRQRSYIAQNGRSGEGSRRTGKSGKNVVITVPMGTLIRENGELLADLKEDGSKIVIVKGGKGGRGNIHFASATNQTPKESEPGFPGEEKKLQVELKLIADVGLVGFPNAGKSTLLSRISAARPKIADYPFTTLQPNLGIVEVSELRHIVVADIPGIIEGAHEGVGLGDKFLRHIERTRVLLHLIDITPEQQNSPMQTLQILRRELENYSKKLSKKPFLVVVNKMDVTGAEAELKKFQEELEQKVYAISAVAGKGIPQMLHAVVKIVDSLQQENQEPLVPV